MTILLERRLHPGEQLDFETILKIAGVQIWTIEEIRRYMESAATAIKPRLFYRLGGLYMWVHSLRSIQPFRWLYRISSPGQWNIADVQIGYAGEYVYKREFLGWIELPSIAARIIDDIRLFLPEARFKVSYLQRDPVLWCCGTDPRTDQERQICVLVWDEVGRRRDVQLVTPPSALPLWLRNT